MSLLEQTWTKRAQQLVAPHASSGIISSYVWILSQPGLAFFPSPKPAFHQSSRFRFENYLELTGKLVLGAEVALRGGRWVSFCKLVVWS